ncbi:MAG: peptidyl-prolyl cis-trans isomerase [Deltaproteobacteria bacterium]|nr:peptidyl-prolyl cis-trans isomerase [Deltaproteobacteria bacterium]
MRRILLVSLALVGGFAVQALAEDTPANADAARRAEVFATVGTATITVGDLEDTLNSRSPYSRKRFAEPKVLKDFADDQARNELYYQGAEKLGYAVDPAVAKFLDQTLVQLFIRKDFQEAVTPDEVLEADVVKYFKENPEEFRRAEMRRARHVLVASKAEGDDILALLASESRTFRALAKERSLDTETKLRGGDLLYFTADGKLVGKQDGAAVDATLAEAAFKLEKAGNVTKPLDLGDGQWSVLELTGIRPERVQTLEQASNAIRRTLWREEREAALAELMADLRAELEPQIYPERMDAIVLQAADPPIEPANQ